MPSSRQERLAKALLDRKVANFKRCTELLKSRFIKVVDYMPLPGEFISTFDYFLKDNAYKRTIPYFMIFSAAIRKMDIFCDTYDPTINFYLTEHCKIFDDLILVATNYAFDILIMASNAKDEEAVAFVLHHWLQLTYHRCALYIRTAIIHFQSDKKFAKDCLIEARDQINAFTNAITVYFRKYEGKVKLPRVVAGGLERKKALIYRVLAYMGDPADPEMKLIEDNLVGENRLSYEYDLRLVTEAINLHDMPDEADVLVTQEDNTLLQSMKERRLQSDFEPAFTLCEGLYQRLNATSSAEREGVIWLATSLLLSRELAVIVTTLIEKMLEEKPASADPRYHLAFNIFQYIDTLFKAMPNENAHYRIMFYLHASCGVKVASLQQCKQAREAEEKSKLQSEKLHAEALLQQKEQKVPEKNPVRRAFPPAIAEFYRRTQNLGRPADDYSMLLQRERAIEQLRTDVTAYIKTKKSNGLIARQCRGLDQAVTELQSDWRAQCADKLTAFRVTLNDRLKDFMQKNPNILALYHRLLEIAKSANIEAPKVRFVGGLIRDLALGNNHFNDLDIKVNFNINLFKEPLKAELKNLTTYATATFLWEGIGVDITQFHTEVVDLAKCDATINGMDYDPELGVSVDDETVKDLLLRRLRSPDPANLIHHADHILRILYYASKSNLIIENKTAKQIKQIGQQCSAGTASFAISKSRLSFELNKAVLHGHATAYFSLLQDHNMVFALFPFLAKLANYAEIQPKIIADLRTLDRNVETGKELVHPEDFYSALLRPYIQEQMEKDTELNINKVVADGIDLLETRVGLQRNQYNVQAKLYQQLQQHFLQRSSTKSSDVQADVPSLRI